MYFPTALGEFQLKEADVEEEEEEETLFLGLEGIDEEGDTKFINVGGDEDDDYLLIRGVRGVGAEQKEEEKGYSLYSRIHLKLQQTEDKEEDHILLQEAKTVTEEDYEEEGDENEDENVDEGEKYKDRTNKEDKQGKDEETRHEAEVKGKGKIKEMEQHTQGERREWKDGETDKVETEKVEWVVLNKNKHEPAEGREEEVLLTEGEEVLLAEGREDEGILAAVVKSDGEEEEKAQDDTEDWPLFFSRLPLVGLTGHKALIRPTELPHTSHQDSQ